MLRALEWCPFLTSELKKCQISDASHWLVPNEPTRQKFVQISVDFSTCEKKDSILIFLKIFFKNEFLKDMEIY